MARLVARKPHWCEVQDGMVVRIFRNRKRACQSHVDEEFIHLVNYAKAVGEVRDQVYNRTQGVCEKCGDQRIDRVTMHMHEKLARGKFDSNGWSGQISLANSIGICYMCHLGPGGAHKERLLRFG